MRKLSFKNEKLKEFNNYLKRVKVAIIGLGVSNEPLIDYLHELGSDITVFNNKELDNKLKNKINKYSIPAFVGENYLSSLTGFDIIFRSPSCLPNLPELEREAKHGTIITTEIEMVLELCLGTVIGITGSDGKTTTTSLIYEIVKEKGYDCFLGGNIGTPLFTKIKEMTAETIVVLELSSFQLMNMKVSPQIAVVTNVTPNHLDIHNSYEEYIEAKKNIFRHQNENGKVILNYDNDITREFAKEAKGKIEFFSSSVKLENGYIIDNGIIKLCSDGLRRHIVNTKDLILRGNHNYENVCAAMAATSTLVDIDTRNKSHKEF